MTRKNGICGRGHDTKDPEIGHIEIINGKSRVVCGVCILCRMNKSAEVDEMPFGLEFWRRKAMGRKPELAVSPPAPIQIQQPRPMGPVHRCPNCQRIMGRYSHSGESGFTCVSSICEWGFSVADANVRKVIGATT